MRERRPSLRHVPTQVDHPDLNLDDLNNDNPADQVDDPDVDTGETGGDVKPDELDEPVRPSRWGWLKGRRSAPGVDRFATSTGTRLVAVLIFIGIGCGPVALWSAATASNQPVTQPVVSATSGIDDRAETRAGEAATALVRTWLSASSVDADTLAGMVQVNPGPINLPDKSPVPPTWVDVADVEQADAGMWRVTVTAGGGAAGQIAAFAVLVTASDAGASAVALPARVPLPAGFVRPDISDAAAGMPVSGPIAQTVSGFLTALLAAGPGDQLSRWTSPTSTIRPVGSVCDAVTLSQLLGPQDPPAHPADNTEISVMATASCKTHTHTSQDLTEIEQYPLVLRARAGRWEVDRYTTSAPGAPVSNPTPQATSNASTSSTNSPLTSSPAISTPSAPRSTPATSTDANGGG